MDERVKGAMEIIKLQEEHIAMLLGLRANKEINKAVKGKPFIGKLFLMAFVDIVQSGKTPDQDMLNFLAKAFSNILQGKDADQALYLKKKRGRPTRGEFGIYDKLADMFYFDAINELRKNGLSLLASEGEVSDRYGTPQDTIHKAYLRCLKVMESDDFIADSEDKIYLDYSMISGTNWSRRPCPEIKFHARKIMRKMLDLT